MAKKRLSGLDELMIVNPSLPPNESGFRLGEILLGDDGTLYGLEGRQETSTQRLADFYLADDGTLYRMERLQPFHGPGFNTLAEAQDFQGSYFLGEDGTLYQMIRA